MFVTHVVQRSMMMGFCFIIYEDSAETWKELKSPEWNHPRGRAERGCSPMRAILIAFMAALLLVVTPAALAGHGGGEVLRGESAAGR